jgi:PAS domain S-box-containing protein
MSRRPRPPSANNPRSGESYRRRAEEIQAARDAGRSPVPSADANRLLHELEVHQIELELQNGELQAARHDAEEGLRRYTALFDFAPIGYFALSPDGTIRELNLAGAALLGVERKHLVGRRLGAFVEPGQRGELADFLDAILATDGARSGRRELALVTHAGERRDALVHATAIDGNAASPSAVLVAIQDVTERKHVQAERERLHAETRRDLDAMNRLHRIGTLSLPQDAPLEPVLEEIVDAAIAIAGAELGNLQLVEAGSGRLKIVAQRGFAAPWVEFWDGEARRGAGNEALDLAERVVVEDVEKSPLFAGRPELDMHRKAGVLAVVATPLKTMSGAAIGVISVHFGAPHRPDERASRALDLLARQAAGLVERARAWTTEQTLRARFEALDRLTSTLGERLAHRGGETPMEELFQDVVDVARLACDAEYAALGIGDDPARPFDHWVSSGVSPDVVKAIGRIPGPRGVLGEVVRSGVSLRLADVRTHPAFRGFPEHHPEMKSFLGAMVPDGGRPVRHLYLANKRSAPEFSADDQETVRLMAARAGTALEIARLSRELQAAAGARENLLAVVSHDLRSPLSAVQLAAQLTAKRLADAPPEVRKQLDVIARSVKRMRRLIDDLLQAGAIESGTLVVEPKTERVGAIVDEVVAAVGPAAADRSVRLVVDVPELPPVRCDRERIAQVLTNVVENALKFAPSGGTVEVRARAVDGAIEIAVSDDGPGVEPDDVPRLFDRYWKAKAKGRHGVGLGLFIAKGIVEAHGGRIWVESALGRGAAFHFTIPREDDARAH